MAVTEREPIQDSPHPGFEVRVTGQGSRPAVGGQRSCPAVGGQRSCPAVGGQRSCPAVKVSGPLDATTAPIFALTMMDLVFGLPACDVEVDISGVTRLTQEGEDAIRNARLALEDQGARLKLVGLSLCGAGDAAPRAGHHRDLPGLSNPALSNPALSNPALSNPALSNPALSNPALSNPALSN